MNFKRMNAASSSVSRLPFHVCLCCLVPLLLACETQPIPVQLAAPPVRLVVASQFVPDRGLVVFLTRTFSPLEESPERERDTVSTAFLEKILVKGAVVTLTSGGWSDTLRMLSAGVYGGLTVPQSAYTRYSLYAHDPLTGETVTATAETLPPVRFERVEPALLYSEDGDAYVEIRYAFRDDPAVKNWYLVNYYRKITLDPNVLVPNTFTDGGSNEALAFDLITDENLDGTLFSRDRRLLDIGVTDTIGVSVSNISQGYYDFLERYGRSENPITRIAGEPIDFPTNVTNGYGYFTTHIPDLHVFDLNKYQ
jgi:hypothetical protein